MKKSEKQSLAEQKERFLEYVRLNLSAPEIRDREGLTDTAYANKLIKKYAPGLGKRKPVPYEIADGLDQETQMMRTRLSFMVYKLIEEHGATEVGVMLGISRVKQAAGQNEKKSKHNWTLAQLQKLAKAKGMTFVELMDEAMCDYKGTCKEFSINGK